MENEQILEELKTQSLVPVEIGPFVEKISKITQSEDVIQETLNFISGQNKNIPALYLKYLPVYQSLAVTASAQIPFEGIKTVGIKLDKHDPRDVPGLLSAPGTFSELREMMREVFTCNAFYAKPFTCGGQALGIVVVFIEPNDMQKKVIHSALGIGEVAYNAAVLSVKLGEQSIRDPLTGLYNRRHFNEKIDDEVNRSRRTHYPLALIQLEVDHFRNYNDSNGMNMGDVVLKSIAHILLKTSRKIDVVARLGSGEFAILCPHTPAFGAAIKAEKIRLTIENTKFPYGEKQQLGKITVSLGVSEYPSIVKNSDFLMRSASDALFKVKQGGRNKVCLADAPAGFKPDFEPLKVPGFRPLVDESAPA